VIDTCPICDATTAFAPAVNGWPNADHFQTAQATTPVGSA
jgi:hypothetical protein